MKCRRLPYLFCILLLCSVSLRAQSPPPVILGLTAGPAFGIVDGTAPFYGGSGDCGSFASGSFSAVRVEGEIVFPSFFSSRFGLSLRPGWRSSSVRFVGGKSNVWVYDPDGERAVAEEREFRLQAVTQRVGIGILGTYRIGEQILFGLGPEIGYHVAQTVRQTEHILSPDDHAFPDGQSERTMTEGPPYTPGRVGLGMAGFCGLSVPFGRRASFRLSVTGSADLLSPVREAEWRSLSFGGSAGIVYAFAKRERIPPPPVPDIAEPTGPPPPLLRLSAAIEVFGLVGEERHDTITSRFREKEYCRSVRCVPFLPFDQGSSDLPPFYRRGGGDSALLPSFDSLASLDPFSLQRRILDLAALRLGYSPESGIVLHPAGGSSEWGRARCERVREYLVRVWRVPEEQVEIGDPLPAARLEEVFGKGKEEMIKEGVWMEASDAEIFAPVISRRLDREFDAPLVKVTTSHRADAGLRAWEVTLTSREKTIARYSSDGAEGDGTGSMNWNMIYDEGQGESASVTALFTVEDSVGARAAARSEAPLLMLRSRIAVAHAVDLKTMTETIVFRLPHAADAEGRIDRRTDSLGCRDILRELDRVVRAESVVWSQKEIGAPFDTKPEFRDALDDLLARRGAAPSRAATPEELRKILTETEGCTAAGADSGRVVVVRGPAVR